MLRTAALLALFAGPAAAWEAGVDGAVCTLTHDADAVAVRLTYDPAGPAYTIALTRAQPWTPAPVFAIRFEPDRPLTISTTRHTLSPDGRTLTVADRGFGNVLDGLQFNTTATAILGDVEAAMSLTGAAPEVATFRACDLPVGV